MKRDALHFWVAALFVVSHSCA